MFTVHSACCILTLLTDSQEQLASTNAEAHKEDLSNAGGYKDSGNTEDDRTSSTAHHNRLTGGDHGRKTSGNVNRHKFSNGANSHKASGSVNNHKDTGKANSHRITGNTNGHKSPSTIAYDTKAPGNTMQSPGSNSSPAFRIYNAAMDRCLAAVKWGGFYAYGQPVVNAAEHVVVAQRCDERQPSQLWQWSSEGDCLVHTSTGHCLHTYSSTQLILRSCNPKSSNWKEKWLCAGLFIVQPKNELCMSIVVNERADKTKASENALLLELEEALSKEIHLQFSEVRIGAAACNSADRLQIWHGGTDASICHMSPNHSLADCYTEPVDRKKWSTCTHKSYFVSRLELGSSGLASLRCCSTPYTFRGLMHTKSAPSLVCHKVWGHPESEQFQCQEGEHIKGLLTYSSKKVMSMECCSSDKHPQQKHPQCYRSTVTDGCKQRGFYITQLPADLSMTSTIECCV